MLNDLLMEKEIQTQNQTIPYQIKVSHRARRMRINIASDTAVTVTLPWGMGESAAERFVRSKLDWIIKGVNYFRNHKPVMVFKSGRREYLKHKQAARVLAKSKLEYWNQFYNLSYKRISIRNAKTRWGSCSKKGNLN